ncbi:ParB N-terminal domain-containing protein [Desulfogranum mediterraneum]|uniref:ParB N-terminal domain-containing protein n=1 Tax=Desulfogranum mediterraneum TaxID=160661 RepID=UPI000414ABA9|nr:ParB N-terminal domain-containing protein [Desulfogranum mediterraneum]
MFSRFKRSARRLRLFPGRSRVSAEGPVKELQCFDRVQSSEQAFESVNRGLATVPLERIVGTVGRYQDFDRKFRPKRTEQNERLENILQAMAAGKAMPPVSLYQIKDDYFILDGHHRVTAARRLGRVDIEACILELLPGAESFENQLYLEKISFRDQAGLTETIDLTEPDQFVRLEAQIKAHGSFLNRQTGQQLDYKQAAADWYRSIYKPLATMIDNSRLVESFPGRSVDDLYLYISVHQWSSGKERNYGIGIDGLIPRDMEAFRTKMAEYTVAEYPEMKREVTFFMLLNVEGRYENQIMDRLMELAEVDEVHSVHGSIDLIVKATLMRDLLTSDAELISQFTYTWVRNLKGVKSSQTLIPGISRSKERGGV